MRHALGATALVLLLVVSGCLGGRRGGEGDSQDVEESHSTSDDLRAMFEYEPRPPRPGQEIRFRDLSEGPVESRAWDFGDATGSTERDPTHVYGTAGVYRVTLRVKDASGNEADVVRLLAVSATGSENGTEDGASTPPGTPVFAAPVQVRGNQGGEPSLAIDSKGAFYVSPPGSLYKSTDGLRFTSLDYPGPLLGSGDSHLYVDNDDRVWMSDLVGPGVTSQVFTSKDGGGSWTGSRVASDSVMNDRQWVAATSGGAGYLLYRSCTVPVLVPPTGIACLSLGSLLSQTTDGGTTWVPTRHTFEWTSFPFVHRGDGTLYVVESAGQAITVAVSTDGGSSFTQHTVATRTTETGESFVNGAVDDAGNAYVAWADRDRGQTDIYMAYSTNRGQAWKGPFLVSSSVGTHLFPWIAAGADGKVVVAWYGTDVKGDPNTIDAKAQWFVNVAQSHNAHDARPVFAQARAAPEAIHVGVVCTNGSGCEGDRDLLDFFTVQVTPDGRAAIAYSADGETATTKAMFVLQNGGPRSR